MGRGLWEREEAIQAIAHLLEAARRGEGGCLFISGHAGLGKSALHSLTRDSASGFETAVALGSQLEAHVPHGLIDQLTRALGAPDSLHEAPTLRSPGDRQSARLHRTLSWLDGRAAFPILLAIDDLHWADPDSLRVLSLLCGRIQGRPLAMLATLRESPPSAMRTAWELSRQGRASTVRLAPLSRESTAELLRERAGRDLSDAEVDTAWSRCGGNPLLLELMAATGVPPAGSAPPGPAGPGQGTDPPFADALVLQRFAGVPSAAFRWAQAASVFGVRFHPGLVDESLQRLRWGGASGDAAIWQSGLLRQSGNVVEFVHPIVCEALYGSVLPSARRELHAEAFRTLAKWGREAEAAGHALPGRLAGKPEAVSVTTRAGLTALRNGALATGITHLRAALELSGGQPDANLLLQLGEALLAAGHSEEALGIYDRLLALDLEPESRVTALRMQGRALVSGGRHAEAHSRFVEAEARAVSLAPEVRAQVLLDHSRAVWLTAGPSPALPLAARARGLFRDPHHGMVADAEGAHAFLSLLTGDGRAGAVLHEVAMSDDEQRLFKLSDLAWNWGTARNLGRLAKFTEQFEHAQMLFSAAFEAAERTSAAPAVVSLAAHHADTLLRLGRLEEARDLVERALVLADLAPLATPFALAVRAQLALHLDERDESEPRHPRALPGPVGKGGGRSLPREWGGRGRR